MYLCVCVCNDVLQYLRDRAAIRWLTLQMLAMSGAYLRLKLAARNSVQFSHVGGRNHLYGFLGTALAGSWSHELESGMESRCSLIVLFNFLKFIILGA